MTAADDAAALAASCASHLRHEELLLEAILPILRGIEDSFGKPDFERRTDAEVESVAQLIDLMKSRRESFRQDLAPRLGVAARQVTLALALQKLPPAFRPALDAAALRVRAMVEELIGRTYSGSLHLRVHLDAFSRIVRELTGTGAGSGRYGPHGLAEAPTYRPLVQTRG